MSATVLNMDVVDGLRSLPSASVHVVVTSPPYWGLRDYGIPPRHWIDGSEYVLGLEPSKDLYIAHLVEVFREVKRVLVPDGNFFLNIGDCHDHAGPQPSTGLHRQNGVPLPNTFKRAKSGRSKKNLAMIPARAALALQDDGWILRQDNIWHKPNPMPESIKDRTTTSHEHVFHFVQQDHYYYNADAIAEPLAASSLKRYQHVLDHDEQYDPSRHKHGAGINPSPMEVLTRGAAGIVAKGTKNKRSVWSIPIQPFRGAHFACFPEKLVEVCVLAGCPEGGTVLDTFCGSGRAGIVAGRLGRDFVGIDINPDYVKLAQAAIKESK